MLSPLLNRLVAKGAMSAVFQPIFALEQEPFSVVAVEGLTRGPRGSTLEAPDILFGYARRKHEESRADRAAVSAIFAEARLIPTRWEIHLNVHASTMARDEAFPLFVLETALQHGVAARRIVLEVLEYADHALSEPAYLRGIQKARDLGFGIALDDVGAGIANLEMIMLTRPSLLKVDRALVQGVAIDKSRRVVLRALQLIAEEMGSEIVVEGLETIADLECVRDLGIQYAQGFLLARPVAAVDLPTAMPPVSMESGRISLAS